MQSILGTCSATSGRGFLAVQSLNMESNNQRMDYHCHLLPGLDDGARHLADSLAMAKLLVAAGFEVVYCTPHCMHGVYPNSATTVLPAVADLQRELTAAGISLQLRPGMEYFLDEYFPQALVNPVPLGDSQLLLVEAPFNSHPQMVQENVFHAVRQGFTPLLAHPERVPFLAAEKQLGGMFSKFQAFFHEPASSEPTFGNTTLELLRQQGCLFQGNIGSFAGHYGREVQKRARLFRQAGLYDCYGSDGHRPEPLKWCLERGMAAVVDS